MNLEPIHYLFSVNLRILQKNLVDVSAEEAFVTIHGSSSINWIVGHILRTRSDVLEAVSEQRQHRSDLLLYYRPLNEAEHQVGEPVELEELLNDLELHHESFVSTISAAYKKAEQAGDEAICRQIVFYSFHESYHVGQLGILRRVAGKPGVIP